MLHDAWSSAWHRAETFELDAYIDEVNNNCLKGKYFDTRIYLRVSFALMSLMWIAGKLTSIYFSFSFSYYSVIQVIQCNIYIY